MQKKLSNVLAASVAFRRAGGQQAWDSWPRRPSQEQARRRRYKCEGWEKWPDFTLKGFDGATEGCFPEPVSREEECGGGILLFLLSTGGLNEQNESSPAGFETAEATDTQVLGVSMDSAFADKAFADKLGVTFPLLSDWEGSDAAVWNLRGLTDSEFVIGKDGKEFVEKEQWIKEFADRSDKELWIRVSAEAEELKSICTKSCRFPLLCSERLRAAPPKARARAPAPHYCLSGGSGGGEFEGETGPPAERPVTADGSLCASTIALAMA